MSGALHEPIEFPNALVQELGVRCPKCASQDTVVVTIGDPMGEEEVVVDNDQMTVKVLSGITFASCRACRSNWELERA